MSFDILGDVLGSDPTAGSYRFYYHDNVDSTRVVRDTNKNLLGKYEFSAFGRPITRSGSSVSASFTSHEWDAHARLYYAPYRYYAPDNSRWLERDPLGLADGPNSYSYVHNNPVNGKDPLGLAMTKDQCNELYTLIDKLTGDLGQSIKEYKPVEDFNGGFFCRWKATGTVPGGHFINIQNKQKQLRRAIKKYNKRCQGPKGPPGMPGLPDLAEEVANQPVECPHPGGLPNPLNYLPGSDSTINNIAFGCGVVGVGAAICATGGTAAAGLFGTGGSSAAGCSSLCLAPAL